MAIEKKCSRQGHLIFVLSLAIAAISPAHAEGDVGLKITGMSSKSKPLPVYESPTDRVAARLFTAAEISFPQVILAAEGRRAYQINLAGKPYWVRSDDVTLDRPPQARCLSMMAPKPDTAATHGANEGCSK